MSLLCEFGVERTSVEVLARGGVVGGEVEALLGLVGVDFALDVLSAFCESSVAGFQGPLELREEAGFAAQLLLHHFKPHLVGLLRLPVLLQVLLLCAFVEPRNAEGGQHVSRLGLRLFLVHGALLQHVVQLLQSLLSHPHSSIRLRKRLLMLAHLR